MNINVDLFKRYAPKNKLEMINAMTEDELLRVSKDTIIRCIKEAGRTLYKSRTKELSISRGNRTGNNWNSDVCSWYYSAKRGIEIDFSLQYSNTDTNAYDTYEHFMRSDEFVGSFEYEDRYGGTQTAYFRYQKRDKANAIRALLKEYVCTKYAEKLKAA